MEYQKIRELQDWPRQEAFDHFYHQVVTAVTLTADVDVAPLLQACRERGLRFFPSFLHLLSRVVNRHDAFKMGHNAEGEPVIWKQVSPSYTVFQEEDSSFYSLSTEYVPAFETFYRQVVLDIEQSKPLQGPRWKEEPPNRFYVSCIPWLHYRGFSMQMYGDGKLLCPIFTWGKFERSGDKTVMPLTVQIHHASADGFHIAQLFQELQWEVDHFSEEQAGA